jgi:hypothetical protein
MEYDYAHLSLHHGLSELGINMTIIDWKTSLGYLYRDKTNLSEISEMERGKKLVERSMRRRHKVRRVLPVNV